MEFTLELIQTYDAEVEKGNMSLEDAQENVKEIVLGEKKYGWNTFYKCKY
ncbi:cache domain-containing protein [Oceanobacillus alkalisoli]